MSYIYKEFNEKVNRLANGLLDLGAREGDKVVTMSYNSPPVDFFDICALNSLSQKYLVVYAAH